MNNFDFRFQKLLWQIIKKFTQKRRTQLLVVLYNTKLSRVFFLQWLAVNDSMSMTKAQMKQVYILVGKLIRDGNIFNIEYHFHKSINSPHGIIYIPLKFLFPFSKKRGTFERIVYICTIWK